MDNLPTYTVPSNMFDSNESHIVSTIKGMLEDSEKMRLVIEIYSAHKKETVSGVITRQAFYASEMGRKYYPLG